MASNELGRREFINSEDGFSVTTAPELQASYPVTTVKAGKTWKIDGPHRATLVSR